ncbi:transcriptional regulator [Photobacterium aquae]|uniref:Transcriptional regulator n=1 Tax=Photobacterium aquae TaxID=1195763 RepID=A0A0J1H5G1_9GAMM|nr:LysR family transcriptional regulator [Photobacterium aquae]KLV06965.1 transcriptional regulator [Photobacterium aquae]
MDKHYRQFLTIADTGNISLAAEQMGLSQPTLTNNMKKLESTLGVPLFIRKSKGVTLTEYGLVVQEQMQAMMRRHDTMLDTLSDLKARKTRKIKMGTGDAWWEIFVRHVVQQYSCDHGGISLQIEFGNHLKLMDMLLHGHIDLFVGHEIDGLSRRCQVSFTPLLQDEEALFVHRTHPLLLSTQSHQDTSLYPLLLVTPDQDTHQHLLENPLPKQQEKERKQISERIVFEIHSLSASLDLLATSKAIMPYSSTMTSYFKQFDIVPLPLSAPAQRGNVGIYHLTDPLPAHVQAFKTLMSEYMTG